MIDLFSIDHIKPGHRGAIRDKVATVASAGRSRCDVVIVDIGRGADNTIAIVGGEDTQAISRLTLVQIPVLDG